MANREALDSYLNDHLAGSAAAVELVEPLRANNPGTPLAAHLEGLAREIEGIEGKIALWRSLNHVADRHPELAEFDLASLVEQPVGQRNALEPYWLEAAAGALGPAPDPA